MRKMKLNKNIITILIFIISVIALCAIMYVAIKIITSSPGNTDKYDSEYEERVLVYKEKGIDYTKEDFEKDTALEKDKEDSDEIDMSLLKENKNMSKAANKLVSSNNKVLKKVEERTMIDSTAEAVAKSISDQTKEINKAISDHVGWPDSEYGVEYADAKAHIDAVVKSMSGGVAPVSPYNTPISVEQNRVKFCLFEGETYIIGNRLTEYKRILDNYMSIGHPIMDSISFISIAEIKDIEFEEMYVSNLRADIVSNGISYAAYISPVHTDGGISEYKMLDLIKK